MSPAKQSEEVEDISASLRNIPQWLKWGTGVLATVILGVPIAWQFRSFWALNQQITALEKQVHALSQGSVAKADLQSQIATLRQQIDTISDSNLKKQLDQQVEGLNKHIIALPDKVSPEKQIGLEKDLITVGKDLANSQNTFYGSLVQTLGGIFFFVTAFFTWHNLRIARRTLEVSQEKQVTERFSTAVDHLGSDKIEVRLGGVYELRRIAHDSKKKDYRPTIEILTGFIRECSRARWKKGNNKEEINTEEIRELALPSTDIQSALDFAIELHDALDNPDKDKELDLRGSDFSWMILTNRKFKEMNLERAKFYKADLQYANFRKANLCNTDFREAILNFANLTGVKLNEAIFSRRDPDTDKPIETADLSGATFDESDPTTGEITTADFSKVDFSGLNLSVAVFRRPQFIKAILENTKFVGTNLTSANFNEARLSEADFSYATLDSADFSNVVTLKQANLSNATLRRANLKGVNLQEVNLAGADLTGADLTGADLRSVGLTTVIYQSDDEQANFTNTGANFTGANLTEVNFMGANLIGVNFTEVDLTGANLDSADFSNVVTLKQANLSNATLRRANLKGVNLKEVNLAGADLTGADLSNTDLTTAVNLTKEQLNKVGRTNNNTKLPSYLQKQ